jgi:hypothetical protein
MGAKTGIEGGDSVNDKTELKPLRRTLPVFPPTSYIDEDGEEGRPGFLGDCSRSPLYVTDGHILLLAAAIDPAIVFERNDANWVKRYATEREIGRMWKRAGKRSDVKADFIGVHAYGDPCQTELAFLRDALGRVIIFDAHMLAFGVSAVHPNALTIDATPNEKRWSNSPLAMRRAGELVGLLMPMSVSADEFQRYDLHGEPVELAVTV